MIQFIKYRSVPGGFETTNDMQQVKETTEFTTTSPQVKGFYWVSRPLKPSVFFLLPLDAGATGFAFRSVMAVPRPPTQIEILTELQKLVDRPIPCGILCGGGDHEKVALEIEWDAVPEQLKGMLFYDSDLYTVYLPL